jgi:hypothetical protein
VKQCFNNIIVQLNIFHKLRTEKPAWANSSQDPILKKSIAKKGWWNGSMLGSEFKPHYCRGKKGIL